MEPSPGAPGQQPAVLTLSAARGSGECSSRRKALLDKAWAGSGGCHGGLGLGSGCKGHLGQSGCRLQWGRRDVA